MKRIKLLLCLLIILFIISGCSQTKINEVEEDKKWPTSEVVEENLNSILSSPKESSNPQDYISAHQNQYENILKLGDEGLYYLLTQFEKGDYDNLRGYIMMELCKDLLRDRNNVMDETLSPEEWFAQLAIHQETILPNFSYHGDDPIEKLVYETEIERSIDPYRGGFVVVAPKIHGYYVEENKLKVFVTTYSANYHLYDKILSIDGAGVVPAAITYVKDEKGRYILEEYKQAMDGSYFTKSIEEFCTMPISDKKIAGLANKIIKHYGKYDDIKSIHRENLIKHLQENNQVGVNLKRSPRAELIPLT